MSLAEFLSAVFTLTVVMDPLGNIPLFISVLKNVKEDYRQKIIKRELIFALIIMLFFFLFGRWIVMLFSIDIVSISIAGGIVLFLIALSMIFPSKEGYFFDTKEEPFIVPLATPLIAGPSVLSMILIYSMKETGNFFMWLLIVIISWVINAVILMFSSNISRFLGEKGMQAIEKLMGMILITISVGMILKGLREFLKLN
ncbi:MAG: NAAT family transporter [Elusimicrobiales bacterium]|nr:NAAT family transporter [Elusimicrobiales bacterium]